MTANKIERGWAKSRSKFRGSSYSDIDINHIYERHHPHGLVAKNPNCTKSMFPASMSKKDIESCVSRAWKNRDKIKTQQGECPRNIFVGFDKWTRITVKMYFNKNTKIIETAYPIYPHQAKQ
jgi:hypothetical protein